MWSGECCSPFFCVTSSWDGHACNVSDGTRKERHTYDCQKDGSVIRSLGGDVRAHICIDGEWSPSTRTAYGRSSRPWCVLCACRHDTTQSVLLSGSFDRVSHGVSVLIIVVLLSDPFLLPVGWSSRYKSFPYDTWTLIIWMKWRPWFNNARTSTLLLSVCQCRDQRRDRCESFCNIEIGSYFFFV